MFFAPWGSDLWVRGQGRCLAPERPAGDLGGPEGAGVRGGVCTSRSEPGPRKGWDLRADTGLLEAHPGGGLCVSWRGCTHPCGKAQGLPP